MEKVVILGAGISGLSCLNALLDYGVDALLIEGSQIGSPKMCGEFLAPEAVRLLEKWGIGPIVPIENAAFFVENKHIQLSFPRLAGAMARSAVELKLAERARNQGGRILENTSVVRNIPSTHQSPHIIELKSGESIEAETVFFATGRFMGTSTYNRKPMYMGMKLHFKPKINPSTLNMYCFKKAYLGVVPISSEESNCAVLIRRGAFSKQSMTDYVQQLLSSQPTLKALFSNQEINNPTRIEGVAPYFGLKKCPCWPRSYWIGDAFATLYPAVGSGFSHGIQSAILAVECYQKKQGHNYHQYNLKKIKPILFYGKCINYLFRHPTLTKSLIPLLKNNPKIIDSILGKVGYL